jgi:hypothetical protein
MTLDFGLSTLNFRLSTCDFLLKNQLPLHLNLELLF